VDASVVSRFHDVFDVALGSFRHETLLRRVVTSAAGIRVRPQRGIRCEEVIVRLGDEFHHPDELTATGMRGDTLRHMVDSVSCRVPQAQRERRRGITRHDARGHRVASGQLCSHIGQRVDGAAEVVLGQMGTKESLELELQEHTVEAAARRSRGDVPILVTEMKTPQRVGDGADAAGTRGSLDPLQSPVDSDDCRGTRLHRRHMWYNSSPRRVVHTFRQNGSLPIVWQRFMDFNPK